jgi:glycyl-tRNA synthetase alpha subunit|tara:strand:- start:913 stop:1089 length:177 start_codon:yes stop_codon:yes gene_type:complete
MNSKRLKEYLQEIDKLKKLDWNTSIKINQQFKDRKEQEERNKKTNFDKRLLSFITNLK